jgi:hypothetical protein
MLSLKNAEALSFLIEHFDRAIKPADKTKEFDPC